MISIATETEPLGRSGPRGRREQRRGTELGPELPQRRALRRPRELMLGSAAVFVVAVLIGSYARLGSPAPAALDLDPTRITPRLLQPVNGKYVDRLGGGIEADAPLVRLAQPAALLFPLHADLGGSVRGAFAAAAPSQAEGPTMHAAQTAPANRVASAAAPGEITVLPPPRPTFPSQADKPLPPALPQAAPVVASAPTPAPIPTPAASAPQTARLLPPAPVGAAPTDTVADPSGERRDVRVLGLRLPGLAAPHRLIAGSGAYVMRSGTQIVATSRDAVAEAAAFGDRIIDAIVP